MGFGLVILLIIYIIGSIQYARKSNGGNSNNNVEEDSAIAIILKLAIGIALVILSSKALIPAVEITAIRIGGFHKV